MSDESQESQEAKELQIQRFVVKTVEQPATQPPTNAVVAQHKGIAQLQAGDVAVVQRGFTKPYKLTVARVKSVSKTGQIFLDNGLRFMPTGKIIGGSFDHLTLLAGDDALIAEAVRQVYTAFLTGFAWSNIALEELELVLGVLREAGIPVPEL